MNEEPTPQEEIAELRGMAADWQKMYHTLVERLERDLGVVVTLDNEGLPSVEDQ